MCRNQLGLNQTKLAERAKVSVSYLSLLERNKRDASIVTVEKISHALRIPTSLLLFLAADKQDLMGLDDETIGKVKLTAMRLIDAASKEPSLL